MRSMMTVVAQTALHQTKMFQYLNVLFNLTEDTTYPLEPYQCQRGLGIYISYGSFKKFVSESNSYDYRNILNVQSIRESYKAMMKGDEELLRKFYYKFLAFAQLKEVFCAQRYNTYSTTILGDSFGEAYDDMPSLEELYEESNLLVSLGYCNIYYSREPKTANNLRRALLYEKSSLPTTKTLANDLESDTLKTVVKL